MMPIITVPARPGPAHKASYYLLRQGQRGDIRARNWIRSYEGGAGQGARGERFSFTRFLRGDDAEVQQGARLVVSYIPCMEHRYLAAAVFCWYCAILVPYCSLTLIVLLGAQCFLPLQVHSVSFPLA